MIADLQKQLGIDASFFWQLALFIFIYLWLKIVFFAPFLELLRKRGNQTSGLKDEAARLEAESLKKESAYAQRIAEARRTALVEREKILVAARAEAATLADSARREAKEKIEAARSVAEAGASAELAQLRTQAGALAAAFVEKLTKLRVEL